MVIGNYWKSISEAVDFYVNLGYDYKDVPWMVDKTSVEATYSGKNGIVDNDPNGYLVGSAEQSFLHVWDELEVGKKYMSCTPCFRVEDIIDKYHRPYFMKVELFQRITERTPASHDILGDAKEFFAEKVGYRRIDTVWNGDNNWDINIDGVEVGSYYRQSYKGKTWNCGTGLAEPRFSQIVKDDYDKLH